MSTQAVHDFIAKASKNQDIQREIGKDPNNAVSVAKRHGHDFTEQELNQVLADKWKSSDMPAWACNTGS